MATRECGVKSTHVLAVIQNDLTLAYLHSLKVGSSESHAEGEHMCSSVVGVRGECHLLARVGICVPMQIAHVYAKVCALCMHVGLCARVGTCPCAWVSLWVCSWCECLQVSLVVVSLHG